MTFYAICPMAAPRMTQRDRGSQRAIGQRSTVQKYFAFRDEVAARQVKMPIPSKVIFWMPIPPSWPKKKKLEAEGAPHTQTPDIDNLLKALLEGVYRDHDAIVWSVWSEKRWSSKPGIEIIPLCSELPFEQTDRVSKTIVFTPLTLAAVSTLDLFKDALR